MTQKKSNDGLIWQLIAYTVALFLFIMFTQLGACGVSESRFKNVMKNEGLTGAKQGGYDYFECGTWEF